MSDFVRNASRSLSKFLRRAREVSDDAAEVTGTKVHEMRLAAIIRRLGGERERVLRQIGTKVYTLHTRGKVRNKDVAVDCQRVDAINEEIQSLRKEIEDLQRRRAGLEITLAEIADETPVNEEEELAAPLHEGRKGDEPEADTQPRPEPESYED